MGAEHAHARARWVDKRVSNSQNGTVGALFQITVTV
jgi:hypothetical protein